MANAMFSTMVTAIRMGNFPRTIVGIWHDQILTKINGAEPPFILGGWRLRLTAPAIDGKVTPICPGREPQSVSHWLTGTQFSSAG
ncbi:MAG: hypothetical protein AAFR26_05000 [Cyanobacteria bacterium J06626_4]